MRLGSNPFLSFFDGLNSRAFAAGMAVMILGLLTPARWQQVCTAQTSIEDPPIEYRKTKDDNLVTDLIAKIQSGETTLDYEREFGYLRSILKELHVPVSSQVLVFSKTSLQIRYISPRNPRAVYFNDNVYIGWVRGSSIMEISTSDPKLGAAFYTVKMTPDDALIKRENYTCLACHTSTLTQGIPGHTVRSVQPRRDGTIDVQKKSFVTDHVSPIAQRWGGWYVTGQHGTMQHMGNAFLRGDRLETAGTANRVNLRDDFPTFAWLTPYSDIVALMVLEHQTQMHNTFTVADFGVRQALHDHAKAYDQGNGEPDKPQPNDAPQELRLKIDQAAKRIVDYMLFVNEAVLSDEIKASTQFANEFSKRGPNDMDGRSLREFNLQQRLFEYPCSYLIYSPAFDSLQHELREQVYLRLWKVLSGVDRSDEYGHLGDPTRAAILGILRSTKDDLPSYWTANSSDK